ncbi:unnamed protein product [Mesocestoides corti]|uniref:TGS domain-containing protein n=1 Tax=Mesocestoides corti TaxID=53468 RepID=A0A0R3U1J9_MESCO|nr:unnamed protein product [Mesocestoides corti]
MSFLRPRRFSSNLVSASVVATKAIDVTFPPDIVNRLRRWQDAKKATLKLHASPRIERIKVVYKGSPKPETDLSMAKGISTPFDCARHLSQMLCDRSVIALVNDIPFDMHRPLVADATLDFIHFKDIYHNPTAANLAFWRSCQFIMGAAVESAFKEKFRMRLLSFHKTSLESGSFVADFRMELHSKNSLEEMVNWQPTERELRSLSHVGQLIAANSQPFECLDAKSQEIGNLLRDDNRLDRLNREADSGHITIYRIGNYTQACAEAPLISNSSLIGRFSVVSLRLLGRLAPGHVRPNDSHHQLVYRAQGVSIPTAFLTHFTTFDVLRRRAKQPNPEVAGIPDYVEPV